MVFTRKKEEEKIFFLFFCAPRIAFAYPIHSYGLYNQHACKIFCAPSCNNSSAKAIPASSGLIE